MPLFLSQLDKTDLAAAMVGSFTTSRMQYLVTVSMHTSSPVLEHSRCSARYCKRCSLTFVSVACHVVSITYLCAVKSRTILWLTFVIVGVLSTLCLLILACAFIDYRLRLLQVGAYNMVVFRGSRGVYLCVIFYEPRTSCGVHRQHGYSRLCMCSLCTNLCVRCKVMCITEAAVLGVFMFVVNMAFTFTVQCISWYKTVCI